jgi:hypothetical protein
MKTSFPQSTRELFALIYLATESEKLKILASFKTRWRPSLEIQHPSYYDYA